MAILYTLMGFTYLFGLVDLNLVKKNFLLPNNFSCVEETLVYPPSIYLVGTKKVKLQNEQNEKYYDGQIEYIVSKLGHLVSKITLDIDIVSYPTINSAFFSIEDSTIALQNSTLQELSWKITEVFYGKPYLEMFFDSQLQTDFFKTFCENFGVKVTEATGTFSISTIISISDEESWEKLKKIDFDRTHGGSLLVNRVEIPNFDNTLISRNPDIHILNSYGTIIYANDKIISNTFNLIVGIKYQYFGLSFLKNRLLELQITFKQLWEYYKNPNSNLDHTEQAGHISWIYIDKTLTNLENRFNDLISTYELEFLDFENANYSNYQNFSFKDSLNEKMEYTNVKTQYLMLKKHLRENFSSLREKVSDKGEKEQRMAYDRIVFFIGVLTVFQVVSEILPLFQNTEIIIVIRAIFLLLFFPSVVIVWYVTSYNNRKNIISAEKLEEKYSLIRQKGVLTGTLTYFKQTSNQELLELSEDKKAQQISVLENNLKEVEMNLKKLENT